MSWSAWEFYARRLALVNSFFSQFSMVALRDWVVSKCRALLSSTVHNFLREIIIYWSDQRMVDALAVNIIPNARRLIDSSRGSLSIFSSQGRSGQRTAACSSSGFSMRVLLRWVCRCRTVQCNPIATQLVIKENIYVILSDVFKFTPMGDQRSQWAVIYLQLRGLGTLSWEASRSPEHAKIYLQSCSTHWEHPLSISLIRNPQNWLLANNIYIYI